MKRLIRKAKRIFEKGIAERSKKNPKELWKFIRNKLRTKSGVSPLLKDINDPNSLKFDDKEKAEILQEQFCSVFTREHGVVIPRLNMRTDKEITSLHIVAYRIKEEIYH